MSVKADREVKRYRDQHPDLTESEEQAIRDHIDLGSCLFFRCRFESNPKTGFYIGNQQCPQEPK